MTWSFRIELAIVVFVLLGGTLRLSSREPSAVIGNSHISPVVSKAGRQETQPDNVTLTEDAADWSAGGLPCYKIETPVATYFLEKEGGGLSSMIDMDGNDWLSFHPRKGSGASGEYRGFPNAVFKESGSYFHPKNAGTDPCTTKVEDVSAGRVLISATAKSRAWRGTYEFLPTCCVFTMTRMPAGKKYWVLYEGTAGGKYDDTDWWMASSIDKPQPMSQEHNSDIPWPEWIAFGDINLPRVVFLLHAEDDSDPDSYYQMQEKMTVFGFGRQGMQKFLGSVPQRFVIGFAETTEHACLDDHIKRVLSSLRPVAADRRVEEGLGAVDVLTPRIIVLVAALLLMTLAAASCRHCLIRLEAGRHVKHTTKRQ